MDWTLPQADHSLSLSLSLSLTLSDLLINLWFLARTEERTEQEQVVRLSVLCGGPANSTPHLSSFKIKLSQVRRPGQSAASRSRAGELGGGLGGGAAGAGPAPSPGWTCLPPPPPLATCGCHCGEQWPL